MISKATALEIIIKHIADFIRNDCLNISNGYRGMKVILFVAQLVVFVEVLKSIIVYHRAIRLSGESISKELIARYRDGNTRSPKFF